MNWHEAVRHAIGRVTARHPDGVFSLAELCDRELAQIVRDTGSRGKTPEATLRRVLQELAREGVLEFVDMHGTYRAKRRG